MGNSKKNLTKIRKAIIAEVKRTRINSAGILEIMWRNDIDRTGLDAKTIGSWSLLYTTGINIDAYERVMSVYSEQPTRDKDIGRANHIDLSPKMVKALNREHKRSGVSIGLLKKLNRENLFDISEVRIRALLKARVKTIDKNVYDTVLLVWKNQPDKPPPSKKIPSKLKKVSTPTKPISKKIPAKPKRVIPPAKPISRDEIEQLRAHALLTGIKIEDLVMKSCSHVDYPKDISHKMAGRIINGERIVVPAGWFKFMLSAYSKKPKICAITPQTLKKIKKLL